MRYEPFLYFMLPFFLLLEGCKSLPTDCSSTKASHDRYAITHVNVIPMTSGDSILQNVTVLIGNKKIIAFNKPVPKDVKTINGKGKWLIPGLIDMHVHVPTDVNFGSKYPTHGATVFFNTQDIMTPYVATGVTTIFDLNSKAEHFGQRNEIAKGDVIGPRMALAALINGGDGEGRIVNTDFDGRQAVRSAKAEGYEFIKVYSQLNVATFTAIVDEAKKQELKVVGHIPDAFRGRTKDAFVPHFGMVAHAEEFSKQSENFSNPDATYFAQLSKENNTWLMPTLTTIDRIAKQVRSLDNIRTSPYLQYVHPLLQSKWLTANKYNADSNPERIDYFNKMIDFHIRLVKAFKKEGVPIVAGTDAGTSGVIAGFALHDEIELLVEAGLTPKEALSSATRLPSVWLGIDKEVGTIEIGKYADLVLLEANPLADIKNIRKIAGVFINGRWIDKTCIDTMLADLSKRNTASKDKYNWKKRNEY